MEDNVNSDYGFLQRLYKALGPITGGLLLDFVDLTTFGPLGIFFGGVLGAMVAWWITSTYNITGTAKLFLITIAAMYCTIPLTELVPMATIFFAICRFFEPAPKTIKQNKPPKNQPPRKYVDSEVS